MRKIGINFQNTDELTQEQQAQLLAELGGSKYVYGNA